MAKKRKKTKKPDKPVSGPGADGGQIISRGKPYLERLDKKGKKRR